MTKRTSPFQFWGTALYATLVSVAILGLIYYWFGVADRYAVFLYAHLGATPFDAVTSSRYWMAGLVAAGVVFVLATTLQFALGRLVRGYQPPAPRQVWLLSLPALFVGIPLIVMTVNAPTLPLGLALLTAGAAWAGLALALGLADWAARRPAALLWLLADGMGLAPPLMLLRVVELPGRGVSISPALASIIAGGSLLVGAAWLGIMTLARRRWRRDVPPAVMLLAAGAAWVYLLLPLAHYIFFTPAGYQYISTASNFFAYSLWLQGATWLIVGGLAAATSRLRARVSGAPARA